MRSVSFSHFLPFSAFPFESVFVTYLYINSVIIFFGSLLHVQISDHKIYLPEKEKLLVAKSTFDIVLAKMKSQGQAKPNI